MGSCLCCTLQPRGATPPADTTCSTLPQVVGCYVGFATVGAFATWFTSTSFLGIDLSQDGHTPVSFAQLRDWETCHTWDGFKVGWAGTVRG